MLRERIGGLHARDIEELIKVEDTILNKPRKCDRGEVAYSHLIWGCVLNDLRAQIGAADGTQILLVGFAIC